MPHIIFQLLHYVISKLTVSSLFILFCFVNVCSKFVPKSFTGLHYCQRSFEQIWFVVESRKSYWLYLQYELRLAASDNLKENYTTVVIHVKDVNDNPPVFERPTYRTQITEEDDRNLPKRVLQVSIINLSVFVWFSGMLTFFFLLFL